MKRKEEKKKNREVRRTHRITCLHSFYPSSCYSNLHTFALALARNTLIRLIMNVYPPSPTTSLHASIASIASIASFSSMPPTVMQSGAKGTLRRGPYSFFFSVARRVRMFWIECLARSGGERGGSCEATAVRAFFAEVRTFLALMEMIETSYSVMPPPEVTRKLVRRSLDGSEGCLALSTRGSRSTLIWDIDLRSEVIAFFVSSWRSVVAGLNLRPTAVKKGQRKQ
jgi:hypothetical protein